MHDAWCDGGGTVGLGLVSRFATIMSSVVVLNTEPETNVAPDTDSADEEEPQNALTQKFTDKEWAALKEFRVRRCTTHPFAL